MSDEMMVADKAGMLVGTDANGAVEVIGWVMAGDEYDLREGETLVTHHKTAEKLGVGDVFKEMKAENAPVKAKKEKVEGEVVQRAPRGLRSPKRWIIPFSRLTSMQRLTKVLVVKPSS